MDSERKEPSRPFLRRHHPLLRLLRRILQVLPALIAGLLVALFYFALIGIPTPLVNRVLQRIEKEHGIALQVDRAYFHPTRGLSIRGLVYRGRRPRELPMLEAARARLLIEARDLLSGRPVLHGVQIREATVRIESAPPAFGPAAAAPLLIRNLSADLRFEAPSDLEVRRVEAELLGLKVKGRGRVLGAKGQPSADPASFLQKVETPPPGFDALVAQLHRIQLEGNPEVELQFRLVPADWSQSTVQMKGLGGATKMRGVRFDGWELSAEVTNGRARIERLALQESTNRFVLGGSYGFENRVAQGSVTSSLPASHWLSIIPVAWRDRLRENGFFFEGTMSCNAGFGPAAFSNLLTHCAGTLSVQRAEAKGVWIEDADFAFTRTPETLHLGDIRAVIGPPAQRGNLNGDFTYHFGEGAYEGSLDAHVDFHALLPVLSTDMVALVRNASFPNAPSHATVRFRRTGPETGAFDMNGQLRATNFLWRGSFVQTLDTGLLYTNRTTVLAPFHAVREEGRVDGSIAVNGFEKRVDLALESSVDAQAAGRAAGKVLENVLGYFRFEGPNTARVDGVVFWGGTGETRLVADVTARQAGYKALLADRADFKVVISNHTVSVRDITCSLYGGTFTGWFDTPRVPGEADRAYSLYFQADDVEFRQLMAALRQDDSEAQRGRLSGHLALTGFLNRARRDVATGAGSIRIREGMILRIRLFGGLSRQLSRVVSGLGFATQTDFKSDFLVIDREIKMPDVKIEGLIISLDASGKCGFDQDLDFKVSVKLLRDKTGVGRLVQFVTSPILWLLEFDLGGTLEEPVWSPRTLPKELFGK